MKNDEHEWSEYHDRMKFRLTLQLIYFFLFLMLIMGGVSLFSKQIDSMSNFFAAGMCLIGLIVLKKSNKYKLVGAFFSFIAFVILSVLLMYDTGTNILTLLWIVINVFFTFFILGSIWGAVILGLHFLVLFYFLLTVENAILVPFGSFVLFDLLSFTLEFIFGVFALGYLLVLYAKMVRNSEKGLSEINTQLAGQNKLILKQNSEMEVMLREIHHRVKNNLQIVSSLLRLEAAKASRKNDDFYQSTIDRVSAMAMVHEKMYQSGSLSQFDLEKYLEALVTSLLRSYSLERRPEVRILVDIEKMQSKSIIPFALLINELILNSLKHAFTKQNDPLISIEVTRLPSHSDPSRFSFVYFDNGYWAENSISSFGTEIIEAMVEQLDGEFSLEISPEGTTYRFELANLR